MNSIEVQPYHRGTEVQRCHREPQKKIFSVLSPCLCVSVVGLQFSNAITLVFALLPPNVAGKAVTIESSIYSCILPF